MRLRLLNLGCSLLAVVAAAEAQTLLPEFTVVGARVANPSPVGTIEMPVSALRYEPRVDVQARNLAEAQADVAIRGGLFEGTGFRVGGAPLPDPQTGHYAAELPVPPAMLAPPDELQEDAFGAIRLWVTGRRVEPPTRAVFRRLERAP